MQPIITIRENNSVTVQIKMFNNIPQQKEQLTMFYNSSKHGLIPITDMAPQHIRNALNKLQRKSRVIRTESDYETMGALKQALAERDKNPSTSTLKNELSQFRAELETVKTFQNELRTVVNKY